MEKHKLLGNMEETCYGSVHQKTPQPMSESPHSGSPSQPMDTAFLVPLSPYSNNPGSSQAAPPYQSVGRDSPTVLLLGAGAQDMMVPTVSPSDMFDPIPGYEGLTNDNSERFVPPPLSAMIPGPVQPAPVDPEWIIPCITKDAAKEAFVEYAIKDCCYGTLPAQEMRFREFDPLNVYFYRLETFTESRTIERRTKPFDGHTVDSRVYGTPPQPWDIPVPYPALFKNEEKKIPIPGTSSLKTCPQCIGVGKIFCTKCTGTGWVKCGSCLGTGRRQGGDQCYSCSIYGTKSCGSCSKGKLNCDGCSGTGKIVNFIQLAVTWRNNIFEFVADHNSDFPSNRIRKVTGVTLYTDEQDLVSPLVTFPKQSINQASQDGQKEHHAKYSSSSRILRQRQTIELLPLTKVHYTWEGSPYSYFVYGRENKVYTKNYPEKCWFCNLL
ncbi:hypothetical protein XENTR_v10012717 [Xenopus tropicalis]|uniref:Protein SSUH2 homolog n=1 Tax=Xenopus tropicalis TaxID=8364 RepID=A0A803JXG1_XENTR|nr:protein SSUH2 homolog [Xenopus tropicalis]KAE8612089.1 hypothetical protein XENTR_v10012717 [Xenopus tropicalis]